MTMEKFHYKVADTKITIPKVADVPLGLLRKSLKLGSGIASDLYILENLLGEDSKELAALDELTASEFAEFLNAWRNNTPLA